MTLFLQYLKARRRGITLGIMFFVIFTISFTLYHLPLGAVIYPMLLCTLLALVWMLADFQRIKRKVKQLKHIHSLTDVVTGTFPPAEGMEEEAYQQVLHTLGEEYTDYNTKMNRRYLDMMDYYTVWVHQIKTPIASMRLHLQNEDTTLSRKLSTDLFRIEQYVEMVLTFLRLDFDSTDYVLQEYDLDTIIRQTVKKFAGEFISRKLRLIYEPLNTTVVTDEKWFSFVIEQILSNALKYTPSGSVTIRLTAEKKLCISDTGIGIAAEDLPRIFENGFTGYNGRSHKKASGIGLYLCKRICSNLGHTITAASVVDAGTTITIDLAQTKQEAD
ncbi:MAG: sensor histidine kinase [Lachnospiraceae bacterium]|nr:sensor histidine kinase [Lachnospiraceae bacterium]